MTPIDKVLFRASGSAALMTNKQGAVITEGQLAEIKELENERDFGVNVNGNKVKWLGTKKPETLFGLISKRDAPPELSNTAKAFVRKVWLQLEKGVRTEIKSKYLEKGIYREEDAISLLTDVDGIFYTKNEERIENEDHTGECDIIKEIDGKRIVMDTKCSWSAETYMNADDSADYEWQLRIYMELYDAEEAWLRYCLVDAPESLVAKEKEFTFRKYYADSMSDIETSRLEEMLQPIYDQIDRNMVFSTNTRFTKEERVKTFKFYRDKEKMKLMAERVKMAREYYQTLTLNGKN